MRVCIYLTGLHCTRYSAHRANIDDTKLKLAAVLRKENDGAVQQSNKSRKLRRPSREEKTMIN
eukprot:scaffold132549_cov18-Prasinocladus_malaysianus.AAC.2